MWIITVKIFIVFFFKDEFTTEHFVKQEASELEEIVIEMNKISWFEDIFLFFLRYH